MHGLGLRLGTVRGLHTAFSFAVSIAIKDDALLTREIHQQATLCCCRKSASASVSQVVVLVLRKSDIDCLGDARTVNRGKRDTGPLFRLAAWCTSLQTG
jgi:hypothetical protein